MQQLEIIIGADSKELKKEIAAARKQLDDFEKAAENATEPLSGKNGSGVEKAAKGVKKLKKSTANAVPTLTEFSRVVQDAPFGIQGVANNITQLTQNFGNLQKKTGSSKAAFKELVKAINGPAGIVLAVSLITSLLVEYGDEIFKASDGTKELGEAISKNIGGAKSEIATLESLAKVARDNSQSEETRLRAINKINDLYGDYLPNLSLEAINSQQVADAIAKVNEGLIRQAKIRGFQSVIEEKAGELASKTAKAQEVAFESVSGSLRRNVEAQRAELKKLEASLPVLENALKQGADPNAINIEAVQSRIAKLRETVTAEGQSIQRNDLISGFLERETSKATQQLNLLQGALENLITEDLIEGGTFSGAGEKIRIKPKVESITPLEASNAIRPIEDVIKKIKNSNGDKIKVRVSLEQELTPTADTSGLNKLSPALAEYQQNIFRAQQASKIFGDAAGASISQMGNTISQSLGASNDIVGAFVGSIISSLGQLLTATIQSTIQNVALQQASSTANAVTAGTQSSLGTGPGAAFVLPALIGGAVAAVAAAFSSIGGFNNGGFVGDQNLVRMNGNETVLTSAQSSFLFNAIKNRDFSGNVSGSTNRSQQTNVNVTGSLRGSNILLSNKRQSRKNRQLGG